MGQALEWMSEAERKMAVLEILPDGRERGRQVMGLCPFHAEKTASFGYDAAKDLYHCFGCGAGGDLIRLYEHLRGYGRDPKDVFKEFKSRYGPEEDGRPRRRPVVRPPARPFWVPDEVGIPPEEWSARAAAFLQHSVERLGTRPGELARLERWGLAADVARLCLFGWNDRWKKFPGDKWGLPGVDINLPAGLVIPLMEDGRVIRLKIRRPEPGIKDRYWLVKGSSRRLPLYGGPAERIMVVEAERDAAMLWGRFRGAGWSFLGTGGTAFKPCARVHPALEAARVLAMAYDNDRAGFTAWRAFWQKVYPSAFYWPVERAWGKDPGEAAERGCDLGAWLAAAEREAAEM